jgi:DNA-binding transcriptional LysR family regulator
MADFDIALLRTFASVADSGGFSRAGERVHRTQSTISQHIKKLEEQAGRQLLKRSARAVQLTPDGERMLGYARRILSLHDERSEAHV